MRGRGWLLAGLAGIGFSVAPARADEARRREGRRLGPCTPGRKHPLQGEQPVDVLLPRRGSEQLDRKSTRLNSSHIPLSRMPSSA